MKQRQRKSTEPVPGKADSQVPAVDRAMDIVEKLAGHATGLTLTEISDALSIPKNAVFRITRALYRRGYIQRDETTLRLMLTKKFLFLNQPQIQGRTLIEIALPFLRELRDETRETVQLGVRSGLEGVILEHVEGLHHLRIAVSPGLHFKLYCNAPGKLMLAYLPTRERAALIKELNLEQLTPRTITDRNLLSKECDQIVEREYATGFGESEEGINSVAGGIFDRSKTLVAALWVSGPSRRMPKENFPQLGQLVRDTASKISQQLCQ